MQATGGDGMNGEAARKPKGKRSVKKGHATGGGAPKKQKTDVSNHGNYKNK